MDLNSVRNITMQDFRDSLRRIRRSVSPASLTTYEKWNFEYGDVSLWFKMSCSDSRNDCVWIRYNTETKRNYKCVPQNNDRGAYNIECLDTKTIFALLLNFDEQNIDVYKEDGRGKVKRRHVLQFLRYFCLDNKEVTRSTRVYCYCI